ncbi:CBD9-like protein, partial [Lojkania enalia]
SDICFSLTVPDINMPSRAGDYYVQIQANTTYSWIGLAQGDKMAGAHFVVVYKSADSKNTTISPRLAGNHEILTYDNSTQVTRLSHSSIHDGQITANIKCSNCNTWASDSVNLTTPTMNWIWAHSTGSLLNTDDKAIPIPKHDRYGTIIFKANAHGGPDSNPWTTQLPGPKLPSGSSGELPLARSGPPAHVVRMYAAHSILACLAWAGIYPIGGIMIRLFSFPNLLWIHAGLQIFGVCLYTAAVGLGIQLSINARFHRMRNKHVVIGLIIFVFVFLQNFLGFLHHYYFKKNANRHVFSYIHLWTGRLCFTLGIINAGFGFQI